MTGQQVVDGVRVVDVAGGDLSRVLGGWYPSGVAGGRLSLKGADVALGAATSRLGESGLAIAEQRPGSVVCPVWAAARPLSTAPACSKRL